MKRMRFAIRLEQAVLAFAACAMVACSTLVGIEDRTIDPESGDASMSGGDAAGPATDAASDQTVGADAANDGTVGDGAGDGGPRDGVAPEAFPADVHVADAPGGDAPTSVDSSTADAARADSSTADAAGLDASTNDAATVDAGNCPDPCLLATGLDNPFSVAADDAYVYWTEFGDDVGSANGAVKACPVGGCPATGPLAIALAQTNPRGLVLDGQNVYWGTASYGAVVGGIWSCPLATPACSPTLLAPADVPNGLAVDATYVYWVDYDDSTVHRVPRVPGGVDHVFYDGGGAAFLLDQCAVDSAFIYFTDANADLYALPIAGGDPVALASGPTGGYWPVTADTSFVYYGFAGVVSRATKGAADSGVAIASNITDPDGLALDPAGGVLYWSDWGSGAGNDGTIGKVSIDGGGKVVLGASLVYPEAIAVGSAHVFWLSFGMLDNATSTILPSTGALYRRAK